jgi:thioredoxin-dependent peroxiredoxin
MSERLQVGDTAPDFTLPDDTGAQVSLGGYRGERVVLFFYPAAMTAGCTTEACDFESSVEDFDSSAVRVVGISPDDRARLREFRKKEKLSYPLLSDPDHRVLDAYGAWGEKSLYGKKSVGVIRSTVVVGADGTVEQAMYNVRAGGHVAKVRQALGFA